MDANARWPWIVAILAAFVVAVLAFGIQGGSCPTQGDVRANTCIAEPIVTWPGAFVLLALCVGVAVWAGYHLIPKPSPPRS